MSRSEGAWVRVPKSAGGASGTAGTYCHPRGMVELTKKTQDRALLGLEWLDEFRVFGALG